MRTRPTIALAVLGLSCTMVMASYDDGSSAEAAHDLAIEAYEPAALRGDPDALFTLARMYESGDGAPAAPVESLRYYLLAAARGHREAARAGEALARSDNPEERPLELPPGLHQQDFLILKDVL